MTKGLEYVDILKEEGCITTLAQGKALETIRQALLKAQEQEKALVTLKKHFNFNFSVETERNGNVWGLLVYIQAKEDEDECDCTADANLVDYKEDFDILKEVFK